MEDVRKIVGRNLKKIRKQKQYTQGELANCLDIQLRQLARIEAGTSFIQAKTLQSLCKILDIHPADLFGENYDIAIDKNASENFKKVICKIENISQDNSKLEFINFVLNSFSNEEALKELQLILKGFQLRGLMNK